MLESYSFIDIFNNNINSEGESVKVKKIVIPIIQRDYAQGREDTDVKRVRDRFIQALYEAITNKPIILDFVYGDIDLNGIMTPLDGQQRLTTLFLLHWYAAKKENVAYEEYSFLKNFSYQTRYSARDFCTLLIDHTPSKDIKLSEDIVNQSWFPLDWLKDQTIKSMLVMLDALHDKFSDVDYIWEALTNKVISFYFLPIKDMGLSDELYIKMNSRGKPLTRFENFKAELEREIVSVDQEIGKRIINKIDKEWTDLLWIYRNEDNSTDEFFLRYFKYICDILCYKNNESPLLKSSDEINLINEYFSNKVPSVKNNLLLLESYFDCWVSVSKNFGIKDFYDKYLSYEYIDNKITIEKRYKLNLFNDCINSFGISQRLFPLGRQVFLYAFITYLLHQSEITENQFRRRIRIINNLINNSADELSNSENRGGGNRIPAILRQVESIIIVGEIPIDKTDGFNARQLNEEKSKLDWTEINNDISGKLFELEDHNLLFGQIGILGIDNHHLFEKFINLFSFDWDKIDRVLLTFGDYSQMDRWRVQLGSKLASSWISLFHKSNNENTKKVFCDMLNSVSEINNESLDEVINNYLNTCERNSTFDWRYYYIKYDTFRPGKFGKYSWENDAKNPNQYMFLVMVTENNISPNTYNPFLKEVDKNNQLSKEDFGRRINLENSYIIAVNDGYEEKDNNDNLIRKISINQNDMGIDTEDRIVKFKKEYNLL